MSAGSIKAHTLQGSADQIGCQIAEKVIMEAALRIAEAMDDKALRDYYVAVATCVMCQIRAAMGRELTSMISEAALRNALKLNFDEQAVH